jgi:hypothetical protein
MKFVHNDGGRAAAGYKGSTGDCAVRAIAIATGTPYQVAYDRINELAKRERRGKRKRKVSNARTGVYRPLMKKYMAELGWRWVPTMSIGSGCTVHARAEELPSGRIIVSARKHYAAIIDGVLHDIHDWTTPTRWNVDSIERDVYPAVYGYWIK